MTAVDVTGRASSLATDRVGSDEVLRKAAISCCALGSFAGETVGRARRDGRRQQSSDFVLVDAESTLARQSKRHGRQRLLVT